ncbi:MAG: immunity 22 family protein [Gemmataceae bacterium]|nr:immunity 22 family protein [Gemmataceae bacterium]
MPDQEASHFWVGHFPKAIADDYFTESYDRDDEPLSAFARDQGVTWYDHDFMEYGFSERPMPLHELVAGYSYSDQWGEELARRVAAAGLTDVKLFAFITESEVEDPRSVTGDGYWLRYMGTISLSV